MDSHVAEMSLNSSEQMIFDYVQAHPDERHYWVDKVQKTSRTSVDQYEAARQLDADLWRYFEERSGVASPFKELAQRQGIRRTSMKNLAEYLLRLWCPPPRVKKSPSPPSEE
jgi:hypothetical protein